MAAVTSRYVVRTVTSNDEETWKILYAAYRAFYHLVADDNKVDTTWRWVRDREHGLEGLVAVEEASHRIVGLANLRVFARPSTATLGLYLDDLYVSTEARGQGVASILLSRAAEKAGGQHASVVRWITAADNATARKLYDQVAKETNWITYDMQPAKQSTNR